MPPISDVDWRPVAAKRPVLRWIIAAAGAMAVVAWFNGSTPREPGTPHASARATQATLPPLKPRALSNVEPVRILNPAAQPAPRAQPDERINDVAVHPLPARRAPTDYQALRREMLSAE